MRLTVFFFVASIVLFSPLRTFADSIPLQLDVPGSIPGTTTIFATDGGITVGTYRFQTAIDYGEYGFVFDGTSFRTFIPDFIGQSPTAGTPLPFGNVNSLDRVEILSFSKTGGIGYVVNNPLSGEGVICCGFVRSGIQDDFSTETDLRALALLNPTVTAPNGQQVLFLDDPSFFPTFTNSAGQTVGNFFNGVTSGCSPGVVTCAGQFLLSDGQLYFNYVTQNIPFANGFLPNSSVTGFVENGNSGTFSPVPEPSSLVLLGSGLIAFLAWKRRNKAA